MFNWHVHNIFLIFLDTMLHFLSQWSYILEIWLVHVTSALMPWFTRSKNGKHVSCCLDWGRRSMWNLQCLLPPWQWAEWWLPPASSLPPHFAEEFRFHGSSRGINHVVVNRKRMVGVIFSTVRMQWIGVLHGKEHRIWSDFFLLFIWVFTLSFLFVHQGRIFFFFYCWSFRKTSS